MIRTNQDIYNLCEQLTELDRESMNYILKLSKKIKRIAKKRDRDVFINFHCKKNEAVVTVAYAHCEHTVYSGSTLGVFVYEVDEPGVFRTIRTGKVTKDVYAVSFTTTEGNMIVQEVYPIRFKGEIIGTLIIEQGINASERKTSVGRWIEPDIDRYPYLINAGAIGECIEEGFLVINNVGKVIYRNVEMAKIYEYYGYVHDIQEKDYADISFYGDLSVGPGIENAANSFDIKCRDRHYRVSEYCYYQGEYYYMVMMSDITTKKKHEQDLILKSDALREAHHRVKNNLQTIYSLLYMQKQRLDNQEMEGILQDAMSRILSIASSYESLLSNKDNMNEIGLRKVIENVIAKIKQIEGNKICDIDVRIEGEDFNIDADVSTDIALVINEIVQNSYKYAFAGRDKGVLSIRVSKRQIYGEVNIVDDGIGFNRLEINGQQQGLGLRIVKSIIEGKLKGHLEYKSSPKGTNVFFDFRTYKDYGKI